MDEMTDQTSIDTTLASGNTLPRGTLILVGTPIGNLSDLSKRVIEVLSKVDLIAAEDTRRTRQLLSYLGLHQPLTSYHEHNQATKGEQLIEKLRAGQTIALVSDAGMPCVSDPGAVLVAQCVAADLPILVIPGPSAAITALAGSGLDTDRFTFEGFLPSDKKERRVRLAELLREPRTMVLYEAPHRLKKMLQELITAGFAEHQMALGRELTKKHEEFLRGTVQGLADYYAINDPRGEYVIVLEGARAFARRRPDLTVVPVRPDVGDRSGEPGTGANFDDMPPEKQAEKLLRDLLAQGQSVKEAAREVATLTGFKKNELYAQALKLQEQAKPDDAG
jgi:16S rRNA (cytidine1402-2'-O)-methyltransferase